MSKLDHIKAPILKELEEQMTLLQESLGSSTPLIDQVSQYFLEKKGKMVRPIMVLLAAKLASGGDSTENTQRAAVALELLHSASLIHDDVIDEAKMRRGSPTVQALWDNKVAVLMGDFFLARCLILSTQTNSLAIQRELSDLASSLSEGELSQLANARLKLVDESSYLEVIKQKTASLFIACMRIGAISVDAVQDIVDRLGLFGEKLGLIFQIRDDIFDYFEDTKIGKPTGNDIREGKVTLPLLHTLQLDLGEESKQMNELLTQEGDLNDEQITLLIAFAKKHGGIDYAQSMMEKLSQETREILHSFPDSIYRQAMETLVDYVMERKH